ncbi:toxin-antitoxin system YwqK family antitoxin [Chitinibacter sp. S2-10]|uniref:toxin-antitoxin system YwqK family antitoxin n=1 Tax=Chitinibacter sp. S2-10 TaxID=3373597 RepID=UPI00397788A3
MTIKSGALRPALTTINHYLRSYRGLLCLPAVLLFSGCFSSVDCNSSDAKDTALRVIANELDKAAWYQDVKLALEGTPLLEDIKTISKSDSPKAVVCQANYSFTYNGKPHSINVDYDVSYLEDKGDIEVAVAANDLKSRLIAIATVEAPIKNGEQIVTDPSTRQMAKKLNWKNNKLEGVQELYNPSNQAMIAQIHYVNGQKDGEEKGWSEDGQTQLVALNWVNGKPTGYEKRLFEGKVVTDIQWKDGLQNGVRSDHTITTGVYTEMPYKNGLKDGIAKVYEYLHRDSTSAVLARTDPYVKDILHGIRKTYSGNGTVVSEEPFVNGKLEGLAKSYNENGSVSMEVTYVAGNKYGVQKDYNQQGRLERTSTYENNKLNGLYTEYGPDGKAVLKQNFKDGQLLGLVSE